MYNCKYCGNEFKSGKSLGGHVVYCKENPNVEITKSRISDALRGEKNPIHKKGVKEKISNTVKNKIKNDDWHLSFSKARTHTYKNEKFQGEWEVKYAMWLDENGIKWRRPKEKFHYVFENKERYYTPDFYLEDTNEYIEIKGYPTPKDFAKWNSFPLNLRIIVGKELKELNIIDYYRSVNVTYNSYSWI